MCLRVCVALCTYRDSEGRDGKGKARAAVLHTWLALYGHLPGWLAASLAGCLLAGPDVGDAKDNKNCKNCYGDTTGWQGFGHDHGIPSWPSEKATEKAETAEAGHTVHMGVVRAVNIRRVNSDDSGGGGSSSSSEAPVIDMGRRSAEKDSGEAPQRTSVKLQGREIRPSVCVVISSRRHP